MKGGGTYGNRLDLSVSVRLGLWGLQRGSCTEQVMTEGVCRKNPPRDCSGVLPVQDDAEILEKLDLHCILGLASQDGLGFGKFEQDFGARRPPRTPAGFNNHGGERETIFHAETLRGKMVAFKILVLRDCRARVTYGCRDVA